MKAGQAVGKLGRLWGPYVSRGGREGFGGRSRGGPCRGVKLLMPPTWTLSGLSRNTGGGLSRSTVSSEMGGAGSKMGPSYQNMLDVVQPILG